MSELHHQPYDNAGNKYGELKSIQAESPEALSPLNPTYEIDGKQVTGKKFAGAIEEEAMTLPDKQMFHNYFPPTPPNEVDERDFLEKEFAEYHVAIGSREEWLDRLQNYITKQNHAYHVATTDPIVQAAIGWYNMRLHKAAAVEPKPEAAALLAAVHDYLAKEESK